MGILDKLFKPNIEKLKAKKNVKGLIRAHKHEDYYISRRAESALVDIIDDCEAEGDVETLIIIFEGDKDTRKSIVDIFSMGTIRDARVVEPFITALKDEEAGEWLRIGIISALGKIKDERAVEPLIEILRRDTDKSMRGLAAEALGAIGDKRAIEPLEEFLNDDEIGTEVKSALKSIREGVKEEEGAGEKQIKYTNPDLMARAEKDAMAMEDIREAVKALTGIWEVSGGGRFAGLHVYMAGKKDACWAIEKYLSGDSDYNPGKLKSLMASSEGMRGDDFHLGRAEILSWALDHPNL